MVSSTRWDRLVLLGLAGLFGIGCVAVFAVSDACPPFRWGGPSYFVSRHAWAFVAGLVMMRLAPRWGPILVRRPAAASAAGLALLVGSAFSRPLGFWFGSPWAVFLALPLAAASLSRWDEPGPGRPRRALFLCAAVGMAVLLSVAGDLPRLGLLLAVLAALVVGLVPGGARHRAAAAVFLPIAAWLGYRWAVSGYFRHALVRSWRAFDFASDPHGCGWQAASAARDIAAGGFLGAGLARLECSGVSTHLISRFVLQEVGRLGGSLALVLVAGLVGIVGYGGLVLARQAREPAARPVAFAMVVFFLAQAGLSAARTLNLAPFIPSLPFPLVGYGPATMTAVMAAVGFVLWAQKGRLAEPPLAVHVWAILRERSCSILVFERRRRRLRFWTSLGVELVWRDIALVLKEPIGRSRLLLREGDDLARRVAAARLEEMLRALAKAAEERLPAFKVKGAHVVLPAPLSGLVESGELVSRALGVAKRSVYLRFRPEPRAYGGGEEPGGERGRVG